MTRVSAGASAAADAAIAAADGASDAAHDGAAATAETAAGHCDLCALLAAPPAGTLIWADAQLSVVQVDEPDYPGFVRVVWNAHVKEMTDLAPAGRAAVMDAVFQVEAAVRAVLQPAKVNLASFGNMTPHVHWHVIPRYADDVHFPQPTWGAAQRAPDAQALAARRALLPQLRAAIVAGLDRAREP